MTNISKLNDRHLWVLKIHESRFQEMIAWKKSIAIAEQNELNT